MSEVFYLEPIDVDAPLAIDDELFHMTVDVLVGNSMQFSFEPLEPLDKTAFLKPADVDVGPSPSDLEDAEKLFDSVHESSRRAATYVKREDRRREQRCMPTARYKAKQGRVRRKVTQNHKRVRWIQRERVERDFLLRCLPLTRSVADQEECMRLLDKSDKAIEKARELLPKALKETMNKTFVGTKWHDEVVDSYWM